MPLTGRSRLCCRLPQRGFRRTSADSELTEFPLRDVRVCAAVCAAVCHSCVIVERLVPTALLDRARTELKPHIAVTPCGPDEFSGRRTRRTGGLLLRSPTCRELVMHPPVLAAMRAPLVDATSFHLHLTR